MEADSDFGSDFEVISNETDSGGTGSLLNSNVSSLPYAASVDYNEIIVDLNSELKNALSEIDRLKNENEDLNTVTAEVADLKKKNSELEDDVTGLNSKLKETKKEYKALEHNFFLTIFVFMLTALAHYNRANDIPKLNKRNHKRQKLQRMKCVLFGDYLHHCELNNYDSKMAKERLIMHHNVGHNILKFLQCDADSFRILDELHPYNNFGSPCGRPNDDGTYNASSCSTFFIDHLKATNVLNVHSHEDKVNKTQLILGAVRKMKAQIADGVKKGERKEFEILHLTLEKSSLNQQLTNAKEEYNNEIETLKIELMKFYKQQTLTQSLFHGWKNLAIVMANLHGFDNPYNDCMQILNQDEICELLADDVKYWRNTEREWVAVSTQTQMARPETVDFNDEDDEI